MTEGSAEGGEVREGGCQARVRGEGISETCPEPGSETAQASALGQSLTSLECEAPGQCPLPSPPGTAYQTWAGHGLRPTQLDRSGPLGWF